MPAMREDFFERFPVVQINATLLLGKAPVECFIIEVTNVDFRIAVPGPVDFNRAERT
jgi:hypothetical protein